MPNEEHEDTREWITEQLVSPRIREACRSVPLSISLKAVEQGLLGILMALSKFGKEMRVKARGAEKNWRIEREQYPSRSPCSPHAVRACLSWPLVRGCQI